MKVLFIYTTQDAQSESKPLQRQEDIPFGISYISSYLKKNGHATDLLILTRSSNHAVINNAIGRFVPQLICFTAVASEYAFVAGVAKYIKNAYPDIFLLIGGTHVTIYPEEALKDMKENYFDALCIGEGEIPTLELVRQLSEKKQPSHILNLWIKKDENIEKNPTRPFLEDLDSLPFPDREMWQRSIHFPDTNGHILLGRGCPYLCSYCCNHALRKASPGKYVRLRSPENIVKEIEDVVRRYPGTRSFHMEIETFGVSVPWALHLCSVLEACNKRMPKPLTFEVNFRIVPKVKEEELDTLFSAMARCNIRRINVGLESGSEKIRREILKREESNEDILRAVQSAKKHGLKVNFYVMIGIIGETFNDFQETISFCRLSQPDVVELQVFFPYPGCDLYSLAKEKGLIRSELDTEMERYKATLDLQGFSKKQIQRQSILFEYYVYRGRKPLYKVLLHVAARYFRTSYSLNKFYRKLTSIPLFYRWKEYLLKS